MDAVGPSIPIGLIALLLVILAAFWLGRNRPPR
jgi:hypothetical protein